MVLASKDETAYLTLFETGGWKRGLAIPAGRLVTAAEFPLEEVDVVIADQFLPIPINELLKQRGVCIMPPRFLAASCLHLAGALDQIDPLALAPLYPREPDAVTLWRKRKQA